MFKNLNKLKMLLTKVKKSLIIQPLKKIHIKLFNDSHKQFSCLNKALILIMLHLNFIHLGEILL